VTEKYFEITKVQLKHNAWQHLLVSILLLAASPFVLGISNLDAAQSAKVLETYVALVGDTALCAGVPAGAGPGSVGCDKGSVHEDYHSLSYQDPDQFCFLVASHPAVPVGDESGKL